MVSINHLAYQDSGEVITETAVLQDIVAGRTATLTATDYTTIPYVVPAPGNPDYGYAEWTKVGWLPRPGLAIAPAFSALGLWLEEGRLHRIEVFENSPIGPHQLAAVLEPVARAVALRIGA